MSSLNKIRVVDQRIQYARLRHGVRDPRSRLPRRSLINFDDELKKVQLNPRIDQEVAY